MGLADAIDLKDRNTQHVVVVAACLGAIYGLNCSIVAGFTSPLVLYYTNGTLAVPRTPGNDEGTVVLLLEQQ